MPQLPEVTDPQYLEGLEAWVIGDVRARREQATEIETGLSYLRRIVQGRLDIVAAELEHRNNGESADVSELVDELPAILSGNVHAPGLGRLPTLLAPGEMDPELEGRLEEILPASRLGRLDQIGSEELGKCAGELTDFERSVSRRRRAVLDVLDRLQDEIVRRYRSGEATVDSLLP
ncbi:MAG: hypothetical protein JO337_08080 [Acidimicrobiales bacterium]|nr:hypothetical protein [Acidimicrobiales bacterium]